MPKSDIPKTKRAVKATRKSSSSHFPSKPYMRAIRAQSPTSAPAAAWSTTDDELLLRSKSSGKKWVEISPLFQGKTSNACRKRHARLVTHTEVEWDEFKERDLAVEFVNAKVGFFKMIAGNMKLEWRQVEKKCIEMGFKTLLEKGKRLPIPFPLFPSPEFEQTPTEDDLDPSSTPKVKASPRMELSDSDSDIPRTKAFKDQEIPTTTKASIKTNDSGEDILRGEVDGYRDLGLVKDGCKDRTEN